MLRLNRVMLVPPTMTGTCAGSYGIPPEITVGGTYDGQRIDLSVRSCDVPEGRRRSANLWLRALGLDALVGPDLTLPVSGGDAT